MPGFLGGSTGGTTSGGGGEITFPKEFVDPVTKLRVSNPQNLIDTDFEYGLQPTKWETVELINNTPSFFSKSGDTTIPNIVSITTNAGTREIIVVTALDHGLAVGIPINVTGTKALTADGSYIINSIPDTKTFTYLCKDTQPTTASIEDLYSSIITGEFFQGSQLNISPAEGIVSDGEPISTLTVRTSSTHGFGVKTPFYFLNLNSTISQEFAAANTETKSFDSSNSATAQTFDGSNTLSSINIDWSNSAVVGGIQSTIDSVDLINNTITVAHGLENFVDLPIGTPLYYDVTGSGGYFLTNPRGVVFLVEGATLGASSSTFKVSAVPNGTPITVQTNLSGTFQIANQARVFSGNNINLATEVVVEIYRDDAKSFDATNSTGTSGTQTGYSGSNITVTSPSELGWYFGTMVFYSTTGAAASGLTNNTTYFVNDYFRQGISDNYSFTLSELPGEDIITSISGGTGVQTFTQIFMSLDKDIFHVFDHGYIVGDMIEYVHDVKVNTVVNAALTSNVATLTTGTAHGYTAGEQVVVSGVDAVFNGTFTISDVPSNTEFSYAKTNDDVASAAVDPAGAVQYPSSGRFRTATIDEEVLFYFVTDRYDTHNFAVSQTTGDIVPATISLTNIDRGTTITPTTVETIGLEAPILFTIDSGNLPNGLSLNPDTGVVSGTVVEVIEDPRDVVIKATDVADSTAFQILTFQINATLGSVVPETVSREGTNAGTPMEDITFTTENLVEPITWSIASGTLPAGLQFNTSTGSITGTAEAETPTTQVVVRAVDVGDLEAFATITFQFNPVPELYQFTSATFTRGGASGRNGPSITQARSGVGNPSWASTYLNMSTAGIMQWTVPADATYRFTVAGAKGGNSGSSSGRGGQGAVLRADVTLPKGQVLNLVVGQEGVRGPGGRGGGGGGASYVYSGGIGGTGLIFAAGSGGGSDDGGTSGNSARSDLRPSRSGGGAENNDGLEGSSSQGNGTGWLRNGGGGRDGRRFQGGDGFGDGGWGGGGGDGDDGGSGAGFSGGNNSGNCGAGGSYYAGFNGTGFTANFTSVWASALSNYSWQGNNNGHGYIAVTKL